MRFFLTFFLLAFYTTIFGQSDYVMFVNDSSFNLTLDTEYQVSINDELVTLRVRVKDTLNYDDILYRFKYSKDYKVSKTVIEDGVEQIMIMTADGSGILIQQYTNLNPTMLNEMMINEVTKESLNYGFKLSREDYKRELISGQKIEVDKAVLKYKDQTNIYEVASIGNKDEGIIIMSIRLNYVIGTEGQKIIDLMWNTLFYK
ncbi:MAG TPA: hypothetical protein DEO70_11045 [Bacteroidales bacterium]|nr:MAG: hypothetical protein A2X11_05725 [Bacteroidetes bacterium GWE2_42_24]HBZ67363.1 hypothetical protein [Bacteroidales bacterium]